MNELIQKHIEEHRVVLEDLKHLELQIEQVSSTLVHALKNGKAIFWCGNGGSASDSQHLAGELVGRYIGDRKPLKSVALSADSAVMTCIANDFGYDQIFSRQVEGLGEKNDVLVGITTSGNSQNIINAFKAADEKGMKTIGLLGKNGGQVANLVQQAIIIPSNTTARIQEMHITIGHILCDLIEEGLNIKT